MTSSQAVPDPMPIHGAVLGVNSRNDLGLGALAISCGCCTKIAFLCANLEVIEEILVWQYVFYDFLEASMPPEISLNHILYYITNHYISNA